MARELTKVEEKYLSDIAGLSFFDDESMAGNMGGGFAPNRISRGGNRFTLVTSEGERSSMQNPLELYFTLIDVKKPTARRYYQHGWSDDSKDSPTCMSFDSVTPDVEAPIHPTCRGCRMSQWDSATSNMTGRGVPACTQLKEVVIKIVGVDDLWLLDIPPGSVSSRKNSKNWDSMFDEGKKIIMKSQGKLSWAALVVKTSFQENKTGVLNFELVDYLRDEKLAEVISILRKPETKEEATQMLWGSGGAERKAQYETGRTKPGAPLNENTMSPPGLAKPVEVVQAAPPPAKKQTETVSASKVDDILAGMGL